MSALGIQSTVWTAGSFCRMQNAWFVSIFKVLGTNDFGNTNIVIVYDNLPSR